ncbi:MAG: GNAT family N-acetyltransferase [Spirulina sp. SIO3F2]|nr:GNAT family N-acetyltransferase [Spirulina sp. SIO3F2]
MVRSAQLRDVQSLSSLLADSFHPANSWLFWLYPLLRLGIYEDLRNRLKHRHPQYECLTAMRSLQPKVIGTVEIAVRPIHDGQCLFELPYISNLAVHSRYRRRGIATQLLLRSEAQAIAWGFQDVYLHVLEHNHPAQSLYTSLGYQLVSTEFTYINWLLQQPRQILLHKRLN